MAKLIFFLLNLIFDKIVKRVLVKFYYKIIFEKLNKKNCQVSLDGECCNAVTAKKQVKNHLLRITSIYQRGVPNFYETVKTFFN